MIQKLVPRTIDALVAQEHFLSEVDAAGQSAKSTMEHIYPLGEVFALVPESLSDVEATRFRDGRLNKNVTITETCHEANKALQQMIVANADPRVKPSVLLREPYMNMNEVIGRRKGVIVNVEGGIYEKFTFESLKLTAFLEGLDFYQNIWGFLLLLGSYQNFCDFSMLIRTSKLIAVSAYDGESYLVWMKS